MPIPAHIRRIVDRYLSGEATPGERRIVDDWYRSQDDGLVEVPAGTDSGPEELSDRMRRRLLATIDIADGKRTQRFRHPGWMVAASLLLLAGLGIGIRILKERIRVPNATSSEIESPPVQPLMPGSDRAWLRLADGSVLYLDSTASGSLARQAGMRLEKMADGGIVYVSDASIPVPGGALTYNEISTPKGGQYRVVLSDGTQVWLNAATSIRFPVTFPEGERRVTLRGEAYFEVARDAARPFRVEASGSLVEVMGTHFNVNAYEDESAVRTTLLEGRVGVRSMRKGTADRMNVLAEGQQASVTGDGTVRVTSEADTEEAVAWKNGRFQFNSSDLRSIMRQIARWYDAEVVFEGDPDLHFTGQITRKDEVAKVLKMLEMTGEVRFRIEGRRIHVSR
jgi:transmembrane sensor